MSHPFMPLYTGDYLRDTETLSLEEHGAYFLLIMHYWNNGPLPNDDVVLARILRVSRHRFLRIKSKIIQYFYVDSSKQLLRHGRIDAERERAQIISERRAVSGQIGGLRNRGRTNQQRNYVKAFAKANGRASTATQTTEPSVPTTARDASSTPEEEKVDDRGSKTSPAAPAVSQSLKDTVVAKGWTDPPDVAARKAAAAKAQAATARSELEDIVRAKGWDTAPTPEPNGSATPGFRRP